MSIAALMVVIVVGVFLYIWLGIIVKGNYDYERWERHNAEQRGEEYHPRPWWEKLL